MLKIILWSYKMTHESFRLWAHGSPLPAWIIHFDNIWSHLRSDFIFKLEETWTVTKLVMFVSKKGSRTSGYVCLFVCFCVCVCVWLFICQMGHSVKEFAPQNENTCTWMEILVFLKWQLAFHVCLVYLFFYLYFFSAKVVFVWVFLQRIKMFSTVTLQWESSQFKLHFAGWCK